MVCLIISLVKRLLIKLGWVKASAADVGCSVATNKAVASLERERTGDQGGLYPPAAG
ncbi:MAG: hypothetical protein HY670_02975 [Chloroflexi bacterium]|nr:hypothetical protein [Chloroflexota bacterium]